MDSPATIVLILLALLGAPLLLVAAFRWQRALVFALPFLVVLNGVAIPIGASSLHLDQVGVALLLVPLTAQLLVGARRFRHDSTVWWLAAILLLNVVATLLHSPARTYSLLQCANLASVWIIYLVLLNVIDTERDAEQFLRCVQWSAICAGVIGTLAFVLASIGLPVGGAEVSRLAAERLTEAYGAYGTMVEPNLLGSFSAAHLVMAIVLLAIGAQRTDAAQPPALLRWVVVIASVTLLLTFTRAAWLGAIFGLAWFAIVGVRTLALRIPLRRIIAPLGVALALGVVLLLLPGATATALRFKLLNLVNFGSQTVVLRFVTYSLALQQLVDHPIVGWGTFSFAPLVAQGSDFQQFENWRSLWIGNYLLLALHDTGILGLAAWCGALWSVLARGMETVRRRAAHDARAAARALALTVGVATLFVPFLATSGFSLGFPWLLMGLLAAEGRLAREATPAPSASPATVRDDRPPEGLPAVAT